MILSMKKVSILMLDAEKELALKKLRKLGLVHIDAQSFSGEKLNRLREESSHIEEAMQLIRERLPKEGVGAQQAIPAAEVRREVAEVLRLSEEKKLCADEARTINAELDRLLGWGSVDPSDFSYLAEKGISLSLYELPVEDYRSLDETATTLLLNQDKTTARVVLVEKGEEKPILPPSARKVALPVMSTEAMKTRLTELSEEIQEKDRRISEKSVYLDAFEGELKKVHKDSEFEAYLGGMEESILSEGMSEVSLSLLSGYIPSEDLEALKTLAKEESWGLVSDDPSIEDNVPTKLKNNKLVSLIYPLTDFLGTVPGYFEYDISGWFLAFMLIFFGIIFGDGGYGILIAGVAGALIVKAKLAKKEIPAGYYLLGLFGLVTILWGTLTCTWFGLKPEQLPGWLKALSLPVLSNVYGDKIWYPFWTEGQAGLTTAQNLQIFCFSLALIQLSVAHILGMIRNRHSLKLLGELGSLLQLLGMFYVVLTLVVNGAVFGLDRVISGIPVGSIAVTWIAVGFILSFIFGSYEGSVRDSVLESLKNIISILLGVVNVFSDIVSYIRLWAVGLAGAAISQTVNEMAGPMLGRLSFIIFAIILLVFGHGLNMILNVLSVIVHGVRLNTLEFSSHMDISWSGHKYEPFKE